MRAVNEDTCPIKTMIYKQPQSFKENLKSLEDGICHGKPELEAMLFDAKFESAIVENGRFKNIYQCF